MKQTSSKEPLWLKNHWRIFESIRIRADFINDIAELRADDIYNPLIVNPNFRKLLRKHKVPTTCINAVEHLVFNPKATNKALKALLRSPISIVHPSMARIYPDTQDFESWRFIRKGYFGASILLEIEPNTKRAEIKDFIDKYKNELDEALKANPFWTQYDYPAEHAGRIDKPDYIGEQALALKDKGMTTPEILEALNIRDEIDESNMRAKLCIASKRRSARNKKH